jgi:hypothetical protein
MPARRLKPVSGREMQTHRVYVVVLRRLSHGARQIQSQPPIEERLNREPVIWDNPAVYLLV